MTLADHPQLRSNGASPPESRAYDVSWWDRFAFGTVRVFVRTATRIMSLNNLYRCGAMFGTLEWMINYKRRRRFAKTLETIVGRNLSAATRRMHTRNHFVRTRCDKLLYLMFDHLPTGRLLERFEIINRHLIDDAMKRGNGVYVALSHFGAQHVAGQLMVGLGYRVAGVRDPREGAMRRFVQDKYAQRNRDRVRYFFTDTYPREIYRCFADNFVVGSLMDVSHVRSAHQRTAEVTIWGKKRQFLVGPMRVALRSGAPVIQGFIVSKPNFRYVFELRGPLVPAPDGDTAASARDADTLERAVASYAANVDEFGRQYPCHVSRI
jgi:lauroyl/myristoyl acyltransferase